jgi:hypothetical protein
MINTRIVIDIDCDIRGTHEELELQDMELVEHNNYIDSFLKEEEG